MASFIVTYLCEILSTSNAPAPLEHFGFVNASVMVVLTLAVILGTHTAYESIKRRVQACSLPEALHGCCATGIWGLGTTSIEFYMGYLLQWMLMYVCYICHIGAKDQVRCWSEPVWLNTLHINRRLGWSATLAGQATHP